MKNQKNISCVIIDSDKIAKDALVAHLLKLENIEVVGAVEKLHVAEKLINDYKPDILFFDSMQLKTSDFKLLQKLRNNINKEFFTIEHTNPENSLKGIQAVTNQNIVSKPIQKEEIKQVIEQYMQFKEKRCNKEVPENSYVENGCHLTLPTATGIKFLKKCDIGLFLFEKDNGMKRSYWYVYLKNKNVIRLRSGINSRTLFEMVGSISFIQICQSSIVNVNYIDSIEIKSRQCILYPPFHNHKVFASKRCMVNIRERFEKF